MYATVHATVLPGFSVDVWPTCDPESTRQGYVLIVRDGTIGTVELVFPSAEDLPAFVRRPGRSPRPQGPAKAASGTVGRTDDPVLTPNAYGAAPTPPLPLSDSWPPNARRTRPACAGRYSMATRISRYLFPRLRVRGDRQAIPLPGPKSV